MAELGSVLPIRQQLLDRLSALDSFVLQSSIFADLSIIASVPANVIGESNYGNITIGVSVNQFEATASFGSSAFSLELPISLPSGPDIINFNLTDASFSREIHVSMLAQTDITNLFPVDKDSAVVNLDYGGTFEAILPINVGMAGVNVGVNLFINDTNIFEPNPVLDYAINMCDISATMTELFDQLKVQIVKVVKAPFGDKPVIFDIDRLTDPLISKIDGILTNITKGTNVTLSASDCNRRLGVIDSLSAPGALARSIKDAIFSVNEEINVAGIVLSADVLPYFNINTFSIGVSVSLSATIEQTAADVLELVSDYVASSTDPSADSTISKLGLGYSDDALGIDLDELSSKVALAAGLDVSFGIDLSLTEIQDGIFTSYPLWKALRKGISLFIDTWGAFAEIIVDPIELDISLFGRNISIRDSHFATSAELRSRGKFLATIDDMILGGSAIDTTPLIPDLIVPLSTEFVFDIPMTDQIVVSPIMSVESDNLVGTNLAFDFDVDMGTFLNNDYMGNNTLTTVLETATNFLQEVASLQLEMNATEIPSSLEGFFSVLNQLSDLGTEFLTYIDLVNQGVYYANKKFLLSMSHHT